jgi:putative oxidoreductase
MATMTMDQFLTTTDIQATNLQSRTWTKAVVLTGRVFFSVLFIMASFGHFTARGIEMAQAHGVPLAQILVPASGLLALLGGLSILLGFYARAGALMVILFLVPVTLSMHNFWSVTDPMMHEIQQVMFLKNLSMLGGALLLFYFGAGPASFDAGHSRVE